MCFKTSNISVNITNQVYLITIHKNDLYRVDAKRVKVILPKDALDMKIMRKPCLDRSGFSGEMMGYSHFRCYCEVRTEGNQNLHLCKVLHFHK